MTLRDYFAAKAMQGIIQSNDTPVLEDGTANFEQVALVAYAFADFMLTERAK
jgi:hypothetical protein